MLVLLSGPTGSGKTTLCQRLAAVARERGHEVAGVLTPALVKGNVKAGIEAVDLRSGESRLLARVDRDLGGVRVGRYSFCDDTLAWMLARCADALAGDGLVFVDEIGRLELHRGEGLAGVIPILAQPRAGDTVAVVREALLQELRSWVAAALPQVVELDPGRREEAWEMLEGTLFERR